MGNNLSAVMLLMGAGIAQDVQDCGKMRILGLFAQDTTNGFPVQPFGRNKEFVNGTSDFMDRVVEVYPGSMFGVYGFTDRTYNKVGDKPTFKGAGDFVVFTTLTDDLSTVKSEASKVHYLDAQGANSDAFDVMYHLIVNTSDSGLDKVTPLADTYDAKIFYVFSDGPPQNSDESTVENCLLHESSTYMFEANVGWPCDSWCNEETLKCCHYDNSTGSHYAITSQIDYGSEWNSTAACPMDVATLGRVINEYDWYFVYIAVSQVPSTAYNLSRQVPYMDIGPRYASVGIDTNYTGLADLLATMTSQIMCSAIPSIYPSGIPTGIPTVAPTTAGPTTVPSTSAPTTASSTAGPTTIPSSGGSTTAPTTSGPTQSGQGGTTTTTTKKPFPIGLVCGCAAGALVAVAGGLVAANRLTGYPPMPEFEFEGDEGMGREESQRETQVAMGEADFA